MAIPPRRTFAAYSRFIRSFVDALALDRYVIWLHDYGSQIGFQLAIAEPERVAGLVTQNGDIYEDAFGPKYDFLKELWNNPARQPAVGSPSTSVPTCGPCTGR